jgi:hypothetical protein
MTVPFGHAYTDPRTLPTASRPHLKGFTRNSLAGSVASTAVPRQTEPSSVDLRRRRPPSLGGVVAALIVPCLLFLFLQFVGLVLHLTGAAERADWLGTLSSVCSLLAWFVLLVGLAHLVSKLREFAATRAGRRAG